MQSAFGFVQRQALIASFAAVIVAAGNTALAQNTISFPARASDLPDGAHWNMGGDHGSSNARDLNVVRPSGSGANDCDMSCDDSKCPTSNACTITRSGNHLAIRKANGDVVLLAHCAAPILRRS